MTLLSRLLGFVRDMLLAGVLGTGLAADAFVAAFRFPNLFRRLFAEGAFNAAFIPLFSGALETAGDAAARNLAAKITSWLAALLLVLTVLAEIFMPQVLLPFVPGFRDDPEKFELAVFLTRICFPYLACMSLMAAYGAILNGLGKFLAAAFAPVLLNVVLVAVLAALVAFAPSDPVLAAAWVAAGTLAGGLAQLGLVTWAVRRAGFLPRLVLPRLSPEIGRFARLALPAVATGGITQINIFIGTIIASGASGAMSYLYYADRLYQLPLGIIGIAIGVVLLPTLSGHLKAGRDAEARAALDQSLLIAMLFALPAAAGLIALAGPVISTLFERGAFTALSRRETAAALVAFAAGLPAFVLIKVFQPGFFAREDTATPTWFAAVSVAVNIALSLMLFGRYAHIGIAIATSVSAWLNVALLAATLLRRGHFVLPPSLLRRHGLLLAVNIVFCLLLWAAARPFGEVLYGGRGPVLQAAVLAALIAAGAAGYFTVLHFLGLQRLGGIARVFRVFPGKADTTFPVRKRDNKKT